MEEEFWYDVYGGIDNPNVEEYQCSKNPNIRCYYFFPDILRQPFVVYYDGKLAVGSITGLMGELSINVRPEYQRKGIGSLLLSQYIEFVDKRPITFSTPEINIGMQRLGNKFGFRKIGERVSNYGCEGKEFIYQLG